MNSKKVTRYYSDCGKGFWKKQQALIHDKNCRCWKNPKFKTCISCKLKNLMQDSNGMDNEQGCSQTWESNECEHSNEGAPVHEDFSHIRMHCPNWINKVKKNA